MEVIRNQELFVICLKYELRKQQQQRSTDAQHHVAVTWQAGGVCGKKSVKRSRNRRDRHVIELSNDWPLKAVRTPVSRKRDFASLLNQF